MAIEIKELIIKFQVEEGRKNGEQFSQAKQLSDQEIKKIVDQCTNKVLSNLSKHTDR